MQVYAAPSGFCCWCVCMVSMLMIPCLPAFSADNQKPSAGVMLAWARCASCPARATSNAMQNNNKALFPVLLSFGQLELGRRFSAWAGLEDVCMVAVALGDGTAGLVVIQGSRMVLICGRVCRSKVGW